MNFSIYQLDEWLHQVSFFRNQIAEIAVVNFQNSLSKIIETNKQSQVQRGDVVVALGACEKGHGSLKGSWVPINVAWNLEAITRRW